MGRGRSRTRKEIIASREEKKQPMFPVREFKMPNSGFFYSQEFKRNIITGMERYSLMDLFLDNQDKDWDMMDLSKNPNITMEMMRDHPEIKWNFIGILGNPNFIPEMYRTNPRVSDKYLNGQGFDPEQDLPEDYDEGICLVYYMMNPEASPELVLKVLKENGMTFKDMEERHEGSVIRFLEVNRYLTLNFVDVMVKGTSKEVKQDWYERYLWCRNCTFSEAKKIVERKRPSSDVMDIFCRVANITKKDVLENLDFPWIYERGLEWNRNFTYKDLSEIAQVLGEGDISESGNAILICNPNISIDWLKANGHDLVELEEDPYFSDNIHGGNDDTNFSRSMARLSDVYKYPELFVSDGKLDVQDIPRIPWEWFRDNIDSLVTMPSGNLGSYEDFIFRELMESVEANRILDRLGSLPKEVQDIIPRMLSDKYRSEYSVYRQRSRSR